MAMEEVRVKYEFDHSFLVISEKENTVYGYDYKMITQNQINGFLSCKIRFEGSNTCLYYDITSKKTLEKEYADKQMNFSQIYELFYQMNLLLKTAATYLLESNRIVFHPEYLFLDLETEKFYSLYIPFENELLHRDCGGSERQSLYPGLADFLLDKINHRDEHAVNAAYQFYKMSKEDFFSFEAFLSFLDKEKIMQERDEQEEKEYLPGIQEYQETDEKCEEAQNEEKLKEKGNKGVVTILIPAVCLIISAGLLACAILLSSLGTYRWYIMAAAILLASGAGVKLVVSLFQRSRQKKEEEYESESMNVSLDEYFGYEDPGETIFFNEKTKGGLGLELQWHQNGICKQYRLEKKSVTIGKLKNNADIIIEDDSVSRLHAKIEKKKDAVYLQDLNSTNGTFLNGDRLLTGEERKLHCEDEIQFGKITVNVV